MNISCFSLVNRAGFEPDGVKFHDSILELVPLAFVPLAFVPSAFVPFAVSMPAVATVPFESSMPSAGGLAGCSTIMICARLASRILECCVKLSAFSVYSRLMGIECDEMKEKQSSRTGSAQLDLPACLYLPASREHTR